MVHSGGSILHAALAPRQPIAALAVNTARTGAERARTKFAPEWKTAVVQLWNWRTGTPVGTPLDTPSEPHAVAFSPDGSRLAVACAGGHVILVDVEKGTLAKSWHYPTPARPVSDGQRTSGSVAFSPDGTHLLTWGLDATLRGWDAATGEMRFKLQQGDGAFTGVTFSPDGRFAATTHERSPVTVWDLVRGTAVPNVVPLGPTAGATAVQFSPDGSLLLAALPDRTVRLWDWRTGRIVGPQLNHPAAIVGAFFLLDTAFVATASADGTVRIWDRHDPRPVFVETAAPRCYDALSARDGRTLAASCSNGRVVLCDLDDLIIPAELTTSPDSDSP
jgi:WD40 repeat protein